MVRTVRYDLGFNWATRRGTVFAAAVAEAARRRRLASLCVLPDQAVRIRGRVDRGRVQAGLFLNTQADGVNLDSAAMLLCRSLKSRGTLVVEDPDDAHVYCNRAQLLASVKRAGLDVPPYHVIEDFQPGRPALTAAQRAGLGSTWVGRPSRGVDRAVISTARYVSSTLARHKFKAGQCVIIQRHLEPVTDGEREGRYRVWHLFGHVVPCVWRRDRQAYEQLGVEDLEQEVLSGLMRSVRRIAGLTHLDWFCSDFMAARVGRRLKLFVVEPANALAELGPGARRAAALPAEVARVAAERIVEVAWRHARHLGPGRGTVLRLAEPAARD